MVSEKYWDERYSSGGNSGAGSYGEQLEKKLGWLSGLDINSITEIGCGDFNFGYELCRLFPFSKYVGYDISDWIIQKNKKSFPEVDFRNSSESLPTADLVVCIDVLFHILDDAEYEKTLKKLEALQTKYLAVTAYEYDQEQGLAPHVRIRKFDYKRFGEPIIREVVEADGSLFFYLFHRQEGIDVSKVSLCLNTKESVYPKEVLDSVTKYPWGEILIKTGSDSPYAKYDLFNKAKYDLLAYQDDDAICPWEEIIKQSKPDMINLAISQNHAEAYKDRRMSMGFGWGSIFPKSILKNLEKYTKIYGEDELFKRDTEKILTHLVYPQNRLILTIHSLPRAMNKDRLSFQPEHYDNMRIIEEKCRDLI